jgi:hypothetical protein
MVFGIITSTKARPAGWIPSVNWHPPHPPPFRSFPIEDKTRVRLFRRTVRYAVGFNRAKNSPSPIMYAGGESILLEGPGSLAVAAPSTLCSSSIISPTCAPVPPCFGSHWQDSTLASIPTELSIACQKNGVKKAKKKRAQYDPSPRGRGRVVRTEVRVRYLIQNA